MTPKPPPEYMHRVKAALDVARSTKGCDETLELRTVCGVMDVSQPAARKLIDLLEDRETEVVDPQYIIHE